MKQYKVIFQKRGEVHSKVVDEIALETIQSSAVIIHIKEVKGKKTALMKRNISSDDLIVIFNEIEMILRANLTLYEALGIVIKSMKESSLKELLISLQSALKNGHSLSNVIKTYEKKLDPIIISFFQIFEFKGNTHLIFKALCDVLNTKKSNKELVLSSLSYPIFILSAFIIAMGIIFYAVIPKFENIFIQYNLALPLYTLSLLWLKAFILEHSLSLLLSVFLLYVGLFSLYKKRRYRIKLDYLLITHLPVISKMYKYYELYNLFLGLRVLTQSQYEFNVALENSSLLLNNKYLLDRIQNIDGHIQEGMSVYDAFLKVNLFDDLVLNLIHSAQMSSNMNEALLKIEEYYKDKFTKSIKRFSSLIEPIFFIVMMLLILWVMLAIFTPIWNMSEMMNI